MKNRFFCLLVAISLIIIPSVFAQNSQRGMAIVSDSNTWGRYHALIIGINTYKEWPQLRTAVKDATVIRDTLVSRYGFDKKNVILRVNSNASRLQIIRDLRYLAQSMRKNDNLFIYYAGHGQLDDFTGDGYWVPVEGKLKDPGTWVANSFIKGLLSSEKLQAKNVVVIADSCYSGSMLRGGPSLMSLNDQRYREKLAEKASLRSRQVISSGGVEPVADGGAEGHSLFAFYLIDALRKNDRKVIDLENLFHTKVWKPVTEIGDQRPNVGRLKTPMDQDGQFVLYNVALARAQSRANLNQASIRKSEKATGAENDARTAPQHINAEEEMWKIVQVSKSIEDFILFLDEYPNSRFKGAAKLRIQQLKRKQNAQKMTASVAPAVMDKSSSNGQGPVQNTYKLALLPIKVFSLYGHPDRKAILAIRAIAGIVKDEPKIDFKLSYREIEGLSGDAKLLSESLKTEADKIWGKKAWYSQYEPDWEKVKSVGTEIDVDLGLLLSIHQDKSNSYLNVYLYDYKREKVYSRNQAPYNYNILSSGIKAEVQIVMREFLKTQ
ncbi:MAG: caspase family protein [Desulfobacterales bacterium]|nr:caspase family protein [Desulfobacterales bacterium]